MTRGVLDHVGVEAAFPRWWLDERDQNRQDEDAHGGPSSHP